MMINDATLRLVSVTKRFGDNVVLDCVDFDLRDGEVHALVGENGAGKSTLMRILAGIYVGFEGKYFKDGVEIRLKNPKDALDFGIGMIHQELSVIPELSVAENLFLGRPPRKNWGGIDWQELFDNAKAQLARVEFSHVNVRAPLERYPLGVQQIVEILRVINSGARTLIMDEPTSALSPHEVGTLMKTIDTLRDQGRGIIYISHFIDEVLRVADRITVLRDGKRVATPDRKDTNATDLISLILGHAPDADLPKRHQNVRGRALLEVKGLSSDVFKNFDLTLGEGEIVGLFGNIGAGHFDLARALFGMYEVDEGTITVDGRTLRERFDSADAVACGMAYATESRRMSLFLQDPIYKSITLPHLDKISGSRPTLAKELKASRDVIRKTNVQPSDPLQDVRRLSGGNQQKVAIARWLTVPPKVLVVSEPTRGMDVGAKNDVLGILRELGDSGLGVLVVSSEPETVLAISDRVLTMSRGKITGQVSNDNLDSETLIRLVSR